MAKNSDLWKPIDIWLGMTCSVYLVQQRQDQMPIRCWHSVSPPMWRPTYYEVVNYDYTVAAFLIQMQN